MDKRSLIKGKSKNGNILCELIVENETSGLLYTPTGSKERRYKIAKVITGNDEVKKDETLILPLHAGTDLMDNLIIVNTREILYIV